MTLSRKRQIFELLKTIPNGRTHSELLEELKGLVLRDCRECAGTGRKMWRSGSRRIETVCARCRGSGDCTSFVIG